MTVTSARQVILESIGEKAWQAQVEEWLKRGGWLYIHQFDSRRSNPGFPDVLAIRGRRLLAIELKAKRKKPGFWQDVWLTAFRELGCEHVEVYVWRPFDELEVRRVLLDGVPVHEQVTRGSMRGHAFLAPRTHEGR